MTLQRALLERAFRAGVAACHPSRVIAPRLPPRPDGRTFVLAVGKAAAAMGQALEAAWDGPLQGMVTVRRGYGLPLERLATTEAAHPVPDRSSTIAATHALQLAGAADADDRLLVLLSGGASSLWTLPGEGYALADKQRLVRALLRSGAAIDELNLVRRHLSRIKGGRLAIAAWPAAIDTLAISDVVGDRPEAIGSGPTVGDPTTLADARATLARYGIDAPPLGWSETVKPDDPRLARMTYRIVASGTDALRSVGRSLADAGYEIVALGADLVGEARSCGHEHAARARAHRMRGERVALVSGGELTVTVTGEGRGGPNQEYALAVALALDGLEGVYAFAGDSDGADGTHDVAGAFITPDTLARSRAAGHDPDVALCTNDAGSVFEAIGDLLVTGPTQTNVNDIRIILVDP